MLEPFHHLDVEVVGRFVHDQQHVLVLEADVDEGAGEGHALFLSAGKCVHILLQVMDIELTEDLLHLGLEVPGAELRPSAPAARPGDRYRWYQRLPRIS
jgi:hypothetical protein